MDRAAIVVTVIPPVGIGIILYETAGPPWDAMRIAGLFLCVFGLLFLTISRLQLGSSFSVTPQAKALVTRGIYSRVRNPIYIFGTLAIAGLILYLRQPIFLIILALLIPVQVWRARQEQAVLEQTFGDQYREYKRGTWF